MSSCFCNRLYRTSIPPTAITEYAYSDSLCRIREFETDDGLRYCLTVFNRNDYKHLHFPHEEYKYIVNKLNTFLSTKTIFPYEKYTEEMQLNDSCGVMNIKQLPFDGDIKIKFANHRMTIGPVTAFGLVKTTPFVDVNIFSEIKKQFTCDSYADICTCKTCPLFNRMIDIERSALLTFSHRTPETVILF